MLTKQQTLNWLLRQGWGPLAIYLAFNKLGNPPKHDRNNLLAIKLWLEANYPLPPTQPRFPFETLADNLKLSTPHYPPLEVSPLYD